MFFLFGGGGGGGGSLVCHLFHPWRVCTPGSVWMEFFFLKQLVWLLHLDPVQSKSRCVLYWVTFIQAIVEKWRNITHSGLPVMIP